MSTVEKIHKILELLRRHYQTGLTSKEIGRRLGIPTSTCYRILHSLQMYDFVSQRKSDKKFFLGFAHLRYADALVGGMDVPGFCLPYLERIHDQLKETTFMTMYSLQHCIVIEICGTIDMFMSIARGEIMPMHCTASGKAILAFLPEDERARLLAGLDYHVFTELTITDPARLENQLAEIRGTGVAFNFREFHPNSAAVAAPIFNQENRVIGSLATVGLAEDFDEDKLSRCGRFLLATGRDVSYALGSDFLPLPDPDLQSHRPDSPGGH